MENLPDHTDSQAKSKHFRAFQIISTAFTSSISRLLVRWSWKRGRDCVMTLLRAISKPKIKQNRLTLLATHTKWMSIVAIKAAKMSSPPNNTRRFIDA